MEKMNFFIEIYFPIVPDLSFESYPFEQRKLIIAEIRQVIRQQIFDKEDYILELSSSFSICKKVAFDKAQYLFKHHPWQTRAAALKFTINTTIDLAILAATATDGNGVKHIMDEKELISILPDLLATKMGDRIFELLILSLIARPGSLKLREGIVWVNGNRHMRTTPTIINCREAMEFSAKTGYPHIEFLKLTDLYRWITKNDLLFKEFPKNSYQYALNFLSYIQRDLGQIHSILYKMMALEKLYTNGVNQIATQLNEKIQIFLGEMNNYKSQIKKMYNIRSRYFHGSIPLSPRHKAHNFDELPVFVSELDDADNLSILLIIATLQKMYKEDLVDIKFLTTYQAKG